MAIEFMSAGIKIGYAQEAVAGTRPTAPGDYTRIRGVKGTSSLNATPGTLEVTDYNDTVFARYIDDLIDIDGAFELSVNLTDELLDDWDDIVTLYETGLNAGLQMWFVMWFPRLQRSFYIRGNPSPTGAPETSLRAVVETTVSVTPTMIHGWDVPNEPVEP